MYNMEHCRFHNTQAALLECEEAMYLMLRGDGPALSPAELEAAVKLVLGCMSMCEQVADTLDYHIESMPSRKKLTEMLAAKNAAVTPV
jgi:hypothetical protein